MFQRLHSNMDFIVYLASWWPLLEILYVNVSPSPSQIELAEWEGGDQADVVA